MTQRASNRIDIELVKGFMDRLKGLDGSNTLLIDTPTTMVAKTNFFLLKGLLDLEDKKGFFVALDRPYQNMDYLLKNHDIDRRKIWYIDTVTGISGEKKKEMKNVDFVNKSFEIENMVEVFERDTDRDGFGSMGDVDFVLIENLSPMLNYNSIEKIEKFVKSFSDMIDRYENVLGCIVMDSEAHEELYERVRKFVNHTIEVKDLMEEF
ncbi:MAG: hypothetical protein ACLFU5_00480 [Thermoplasmata archaeon]